ncbi:MAG: aldose 1-epimerase [Gemmataceae bacterium]
MPFSVKTQSATAGAKTDTAYTLADTAGTVRAEVWPAFGFNCLRWQVRRADGIWGDVLYCDPAWEQNPVPTRSGHPILFPFPNRLRNGRFTFDGREYQLPLNDSTGTHAIHGFTPRNPWRVVGAGGERDHAFVTGQFQLSVDLPSALAHWPADFVFTVTYHLRADGLTVELLVENPDTKPLPFGVGFHPYFACPNAAGATADEMVLQAPTNEVWEDESNLPTGRRLAVPMELDFRQPRNLSGVNLDTLFAAGEGGWTATLGHISAGGVLTVSAPAEFRELLLFTPPHRKAVAVEPYTCATDAANLPDAGWRVLPPGGEFAVAVTYSWGPSVRLTPTVASAGIAN